ncbi:MAG: hypothetical protein ACYT04_85080, partial [Nostoc sp.]
GLSDSAQDRVNLRLNALQQAGLPRCRQNSFSRLLRRQRLTIAIWMPKPPSLVLALVKAQVLLILMALFMKGQDLTS